MHNYYTYITTNPGKTTFYTGVTNDLYRRLQKHYENRGKNKTFAGRYYCYKLLYFEHCPDVRAAIAREKEIKAMSREEKAQLIKTLNPELNFLVL
jgi:putative endonuclease